MVNRFQRRGRRDGAGGPEPGAEEEEAGGGGPGEAAAAPEVTPEGERGSGVAAVVSRVRAAAEALGLRGEIAAFGSHVSGFSTAASDCDLSYLAWEGGGDAAETPVQVLQRFANELPRHGFGGIITVFQATIPLVKAIDPSGVEVDLCVDNRLGLQNSKLVAAYCGLDPRVSQVGRLVKRWAKAWELVGSSDGHLTSYAYTLLTIYYLMHRRPPVLPNLQDLAAQSCEPVIVRDKRWGREIPWDCKFWEDTELIPQSSNAESAEALLRGFFQFYTTFDWVHHAVSIRLAMPNGSPIPKLGLYSSVPKDQWYVEDPFDLRHNLASQCTREGRQRILEKMRGTLALLSAVRSEDAMLVRFQKHCSGTPKVFLLKCRVHTEKVTAAELVEALRAVRDVGPFTVSFPVAPGLGSREFVEAFAIFQSADDRRRVHRLNETYVGAWQLRLLPCSTWALEDAMRTCQYETLEVVPKAPAHEEAEAAEALPGDKASEEVRAGLRVAQNESEVQVLIQRAQALGLAHEVERGGHKLRLLAEGAPGGPHAAGGEERHSPGADESSGPEGLPVCFQ